MVHRGFSLQASYRIRAGVPVVHLYGRLADGRSFLVRDGRERPYFYICVGDIGGGASVGREAVAGGEVARVLADADAATASSAMRSFEGDRLVRVEVAVPADAASL